MGQFCMMQVTLRLSGAYITRHEVEARNRRNDMQNEVW